MRDCEHVKEMLSVDAPCRRIWAGKGYYFVRTPRPDEFPDVVFRDGCHIVEVRGVPVTWAWSSRESKVAVEAAVETPPEFRRRGYARQAVSSWAHYTMKAGKVPFHSHENDNEPSEGLARRLGVVQYSTVVTYY
jgi:RimJ/RimL family protein N-acetyltransferase